MKEFFLKKKQLKLKLKINRIKERKKKEKKRRSRFVTKGKTFNKHETNSKFFKKILIKNQNRMIYRLVDVCPVERRADALQQRAADEQRIAEREAERDDEQHERAGARVGADKRRRGCLHAYCWRAVVAERGEVRTA